jgi:hypothetical protein
LRISSSVNVKTKSGEILSILVLNKRSVLSKIVKLSTLTSLSKEFSFIILLNVFINYVLYTGESTTVFKILLSCSVVSCLKGTSF